MQTTDRILVVDHDREARELLAAYLHKYGLRAHAVSNARQMRAAIRDQGPFDLIVLDYALPGETRAPRLLQWIELSVAPDAVFPRAMGA